MNEKEKRSIWGEYLRNFLVPSVCAVIISAGAIYLSPDSYYKLLVHAVPSIFISYVLYSIYIHLGTLRKLRELTINVKKNRDSDEFEYKNTKLLLADTRSELLSNVEHIKFVGEISGKVARIKDKSEIIRAVGTRAVDAFVEKLEVDIAEDTVAFPGQHTSLAAYAELWRMLAKEQTKRKRDGLPNLVARITHSNSIEIWLQEGLNKRGEHSSISKYEEIFTAEHGKIFRILDKVVENSSSNQMHQEYLEAAKQMELCGITPAFVETAALANGDLSDPEYDFILVDLGDQKLSLKWMKLGNARYIAGCQISGEFRIYDEDCDPKWRQYIKKLEDRTSQDHNLPAELRKLNNRFIKKYRNEFPSI